MLAVDDERVDRDLRVAQHERQRVDAEDGESDRDLDGVPAPGAGTGQDGEDDAVPGVVEQPAEPRGGGVEPRVPGEDVLGVRVGAMLAHEREHGGQVVDARRARDHAGSRTSS